MVLGLDFFNLISDIGFSFSPRCCLVLVLGSRDIMISKLICVCMYVCRCLYLRVSCETSSIIQSVVSKSITIQEKQKQKRNINQSMASRAFSAAPSFSETRIPTRHSPRMASQFTHGCTSMNNLAESFPAPRSNSPFPPGWNGTYGVML